MKLVGPFQTGIFCDSKYSGLHAYQEKTDGHAKVSVARHDPELR